MPDPPLVTAREEGSRWKSLLISSRSRYIRSAELMAHLGQEILTTRYFINDKRDISMVVETEDQHPELELLFYQGTIGIMRQIHPFGSHRPADGPLRPMPWVPSQPEAERKLIPHVETSSIDLSEVELDDDVSVASAKDCYEINIGDDKATKQHIDEKIAFLTQPTLKLLTKAWIKVREPKKTAWHPYVGGARTKPCYWPHDVIHKEPDHLNMEERLKLAKHLMWDLGCCVNTLRQSTEHKNLASWEKDLLNELYNIKEAQEKVFDGAIGQSVMGQASWSHLLTSKAEPHSMTVTKPSQMKKGAAQRRKHEAEKRKRAAETGSDNVDRVRFQPIIKCKPEPAVYQGWGFPNSGSQECEWRPVVTCSQSNSPTQNPLAPSGKGVQQHNHSDELYGIKREQGALANEIWVHSHGNSGSSTPLPSLSSTPTSFDDGGNQSDPYGITDYPPLGDSVSASVPHVPSSTFAHATQGQHNNDDTGGQNSQVAMPSSSVRYPLSDDTFSSQLRVQQGPSVLDTVLVLGLKQVESHQLSLLHDNDQRDYPLSLGMA
ncbi:MAG: hypothetical protein Q9214_004760 [Letrouitia sp. 1 TL-2023]